MGLIEDNEINNNTLAGVWITTGKYPGHVTTINYLHFLNGNFNKVLTSGVAAGFFKGRGWGRRWLVPWVCRINGACPQMLQFDICDSTRLEVLAM